MLIIIIRSEYMKNGHRTVWIKEYMCIYRIGIRTSTLTSSHISGTKIYYYRKKNTGAKLKKKNSPHD